MKSAYKKTPITLASLILFLSTSCNAENLEPPTSAKNMVQTTDGYGTLETKQHLNILNLHGSWYEMGFQYGRLMTNKIHDADKLMNDKFFGIYSKGIPYIPRYLANSLMYSLLHSILSQQEKDVISGISDATGIPYDRLLTVNFGIYIFTINDLIAPEHCSFVSVYNKLTDNGDLFVGRTMDYEVDAKNVFVDPAVVVYHPNNGDNQIATFGSVGFIPGINVVAYKHEQSFFMEADDATSSAPTDVGYLLNYLNDGTDPLHQNFQVALSADSIDDAVEKLKGYRNLTASIVGIANKDKAIRVEKPTATIWYSQPPLKVSDGQSDSSAYFTNLFWTPFKMVVNSVETCRDKPKDSPSYSCLRYYNIKNFIDNSNKITKKDYANFLTKDLDDGGINVVAKSTLHPSTEMTIAAVFCNMKTLDCSYHDFRLNKNSWIELNLLDYFDKDASNN